MFIFLYDFGDPHDQRVFLDRFSEKISQDKFFIVVRGNGMRSLIQNKYPEFWACNGVIHAEKWSLYSSDIDLTPYKELM